MNQILEQIQKEKGRDGRQQRTEDGHPLSS